MPTNATAVDSQIYRDTFSTSAMREVWSDQTRIQRYLDVEKCWAWSRGASRDPEQAAAGELREQTRLAHLDYLKQHSAVMHLGGPFKNSDGGIIGTLLLVDLPDRAAAMRFTDEEPFHKAGVFESALAPDAARGRARGKRQ